MKGRPIPVVVIACLLIVIGAVGFVGHARDGGKDLPMILATELAALVAGVFLLRGANWARWLAMVWMAFHVVLSIHAVQPLIIHSAFLVVFAVCLFYPAANAYFQRRVEQ